MSQLMVGFSGPKIPSWLKEFSQTPFFGGVILFDYDYQKKTYENNILSREQVKSLIKELRELKPGAFVAIDQEGGKVSRLKPERGFRSLPSAKKMADYPSYRRRQIWDESFSELAELGFNLILAPVIDVLYNPQSPDIGCFERSFSSDPQEIFDLVLELFEVGSRYPLQFCLKHYPGLGEATTNSHEKVTWIPTPRFEQEKLFWDLLPRTPGGWIMISHAWVREWDLDWPVSLSERAIERIRIHTEGRIITDDLQMKGLRNEWPLSKIIQRCFQLKHDLLLIGNNLESEVEFLRVWREDLQNGKLLGSTLE